MQERLILVNENDEVVGFDEKLKIHREGLLHRAFSIFILNSQGELLMQRRAANKYHSPGLWSNTCCGHPLPGEQVLVSARRRLKAEMGLDCPLKEVGTVIYRQNVGGGLIEHEFDHILMGQSDDDPTLNLEEAIDWKRTNFDMLKREVKSRPVDFTAWLRIIITQFPNFPIGPVKRFGRTYESVPMPISNKDIAKYFDRHQVIYTLFWSRRALHCGFWYEDTKNLADAILNTDKFIVDVLAISFNDTVLDAGCGVGGTSIHIAETAGATVEGLTLSDVQLRIAQKRAARSPAAGKLNFSKQDFTETSFKENTFSKVFGIESICYAHRKIDFLNEAYRILIPGGKIAVVDLFLTEEMLTVQNMKTYANTIEGCAVPNLSSIAQFRASLEQAGFKLLAFYNMTDHIKKSSHKLYYRALPTYPFEVLKQRLQLGRVNFTPVCQRAFFDTGIGTYGVFVALKT